MIDENTERPAFEGVEKLYGQDGYKVLNESHVAIIGLGGVGSWAAEALARTGIGTLTLVDLDEICRSNINRQVHALATTIGQAKIDAMRSRILMINPKCKVNLVHDFLVEENFEQILAGGYDFVIDAIDGVTNKCRIINYCYRHDIPIITCGAAGAMDNPFSIQLEDLNRCIHDRLLRFIRRKLRTRFDFPRREKKKWGIPAIYTPDTACMIPKESGSCAIPQSAGMKLDCAGHLGSVCFVTGTMGFFAASYVVNELVNRGRVGVN